MVYALHIFRKMVVNICTGLQFDCFQDWITTGANKVTQRNCLIGLTDNIDNDLDEKEENKRPMFLIQNDTRLPSDSAIGSYMRNYYFLLMLNYSHGTRIWWYQVTNISYNVVLHFCLPYLLTVTYFPLQTITI